MIAGEWAKVEMLGHRVVFGQLSEVTVAGAPMLRVDVPSTPAGVVLVAPASLYAISPTTEEACRARFAAPLELDVVDGYVDDDDDDGDRW